MDATSKVSVVVGGQFGSEAKGHLAAYLARRTTGRVSAVRVAGPNAGHTVIDEGRAGSPAGFEWKLRTIPVPAVSRPDSRLYIAAGSEIDPTVLDTERADLNRAGYQIDSRLIIDSSATRLTQEHINAELGMHERMGSTGKGIGAARADRIMRQADIFGGAMAAEHGRWVDTASLLRQDLADGSHVVIEGTQGYGLGLHTKHYPYVTSSDCRAIDFLAMTGLSPWDPVIRALDVWVVFRTRPIRVAGNSGKLKGETTWGKLELPEERTTVTNKVRRVGEWDPRLAREAVAANGENVRICLTMVDQVFPWIKGATDISQLTSDQEQTLIAYLTEIEDATGSAIVELIGTSPNTMMPVVGAL